MSTKQLLSVDSIGIVSWQEVILRGLQSLRENQKFADAMEQTCVVLAAKRRKIKAHSVSRE
jgi:hypothetical protein